MEEITDRAEKLVRKWHGEMPSWTKEQSAADLVLVELINDALHAAKLEGAYKIKEKMLELVDEHYIFDSFDGKYKINKFDFMEAIRALKLEEVVK